MGPDEQNSVVLTEGTTGNIVRTWTFLLTFSSSGSPLKIIFFRCPNMAVRQAEENDGDDDQDIEPISVRVTIVW